MRRHLIILYIMTALSAYGQREGAGNPAEGLRYDLSLQTSFADGNTPLWLNANKYGLSSLESNNGYVRAAVTRPISTDDGRRWGVGYGVDVAVPYNYTSHFVVQQAFAEVRWLKGVLSVGSKEYPMELKNNRLSSGSQTLGINARPVPQVRLALPEYWTVPLTRGWLHFKGHLAYGKMTDDAWQKDFTDRQSRFTEDVLYHSKAGYLKIGKDDGRHPLSLEIGLEMAAEFGGRRYMPNGDGTYDIYENGTGLSSYWNAFISGGSEAKETTYQNVEGNHLGSWVARLSWDARTWRLAVYADKYFEDHSSMFQLDYDGYGEGDDWDVKEDNRYLLYDFKDIMLGAELNLKKGTWVRDIVFEYLYTKYQSGPIYHDHTEGLSDHIGGKDDYYNHGLYNGWQHWGQVIGNPLYLSPIYNTDGTLTITNNRFMAFHLGIDGNPAPRLEYRVLLTWQDGLGTYDNPYKHVEEDVSFLVEASYRPAGRWFEGWSLTGAIGADFGDIRGDNSGFQLTVRKTGALNFKRSGK